MKTYYVKVSHKEASLNQYYSIKLDEYFTKEALDNILSNATKYRVKVYDKVHFETFFKDICKDRSDKESIYDLVVPFFNLKDLVEHIKTVKLYKKLLTPIYKNIESHEVKLFKLSYCFKIEDVSQNSNGDITFFKVVKDPEGIKDVEFVDEDIKRTLHCKQAVNGYYYMYGVWKFFRDKNHPVQWMAKKAIRNRIIVDYKEEEVLL